MELWLMRGHFHLLHQSRFIPPFAALSALVQRNRRVSNNQVYLCTY